MSSTTTVGLNVCVLGVGYSSSSSSSSNRSRRGVCCHGLLPSEKQGRRAFFSLVGILSNPSLSPFSPAYGTTTVGEEPEKAAPSGEETDIMKRKRIQNSGIEQPFMPFLNIASADMLVDEGEIMMRAIDSPLLLYLNTVGYMASAVLGCLFWYERQTKTSSDDELQYLKPKLEARENAILALKQKLEARIFDEKRTELELLKERELKSTLFNDLESSVRLCDELKMKIQDNMRLIQELHSQIKVFEGAIEEGGRHEARLEETLLEVKKKTIDSEEKIKELMFDMQNMESETPNVFLALEKKEQDIARLSLELNRKNESLAESQQMIEDMERSLNEKDKEIAKNESALQALKALLSEAIARCAELDKEVMSMTEELDALSLEKSQKVQAAIISKEVECKLLTEKLTLALKTSNERKESVVSLQEEINSLNHAIHERDTEIQSINSDLSSYAHGVKGAEDRISSLSCELEELKDENARLAKQKSELGLKLEADLMVLKHALHKEQQFLALLKGDIQKVKNALDRSNNEVGSLREKSMKCENSYNKLKSEVVLSAENVRVIGVDIEKHKELADTSNKELSLAWRMVIEAKRELKLLEQDSERAKLEKENLINYIFDLHEQLDSTHLRVTGLEADKQFQSETLDNKKKSSVTA